MYDMINTYTERIAYGGNVTETEYVHKSECKKY